MNRFASILTLIVIFLILSPGAEVHAIECSKPAARPFRMFNGLFFEGQPDLAAFGLKPIHIVDRGIWAPGVSRIGPPDASRVRSYVRSLPDDDAPIVLDFEDYDLAKDDAQARSGIARLEKILAAFRASGTRRELGFYGYVPLIDYWRAVAPSGSEKYTQWQKQNDRAAPLARNVDALFPSIYTYYPKEEQWVTYASAQICEARRLSSKPVYVFLWPNYHNEGNPRPPRPIPGKYWRLQLETAYRLADGIIIWGGWDEAASKKAPWDPNAEWWHETTRFMEEIKPSR